MAERASRRMSVLTSSSVGTIFSMEASTMCTLGSDCVRSPLPSLVTMTEEPVSAIRKLAPVMPTSAARNFSRRIWRASATSCAGSISCAVAGQMGVQAAEVGLDLVLGEVDGRAR